MRSSEEEDSATRKEGKVRMQCRRTQREPSKTKSKKKEQTRENGEKHRSNWRVAREMKSHGTEKRIKNLEEAKTDTPGSR